jgi:predicted ATPase
MAASNQAPTGPTVTFVFTDIEDTPLLRESSEQPNEQWYALYHAVIRHEVRTHGGYEADLSDHRFTLAFHSVIDAIQCCMAVHHRLLDAPWPAPQKPSAPRSPAAPFRRSEAGLLARMAVHTGQPTIRVNPSTDRPEYDGDTLHHGALLCAAGGGGQVLLSNHTLQLALETLGDPSLLPGHLTDLGQKPLEESTNQERTWQLLPPPLQPNTLRQAQADPSQNNSRNLLDPMTPLIGREVELQQLKLRHKQGARLITLLGGGGVGKTHLATHYAQQTHQEFSGGVLLADLSEARTANDVCGAVAKALSLPLTTKNPVIQVGDAIAARGEVMLLLENLEQVVAAASEAVGVWLKLAPRARFLITSRQVLWIRGEYLLAVDRLPLPPESIDLSAEGALQALRSCDAVNLFCVRAEQADPEFKLRRDNALEIAHIVRCFDGLPLAITLAASQVRFTHPKQLLQRIQHRMERATGGGKPGGDRQAILHGAIDWAWRTLPPWEQATLCHCAIFRGGFDLAACAQVLDLSPWPEAPSPTEVVHTLHHKQLIFRTRHQDDTNTRFSMHRSIQRYAEEKLKTLGAISGESGHKPSGPEAYQTAVHAHGDYFAKLASSSSGPPLALLSELHNLVMGASKAAQEQRPRTTSTCAMAAIGILKSTGPASAIVDLTNSVLGVQDLTLSERMWVLNARGEALRIIGKSTSARASLEQALDMAYRQQDHGFEAEVQLNLSVLSKQIGRTEAARTHAEKALELSLSSGDRAQATRVLSTLGRHHHTRGEVEAGQQYFEQAKALLAEIQEPLLTAVAALSTAEIDHIQGRVEQAEVAYRRADAIFERQGDHVHQCITRILLGRLRADNAAHGAARALFAKALNDSRALGNRRFEGLALAGLAGVSVRKNRFMEAAEHIAAALPILEEVGDPAAEGYAWGLQAEVHSIQRADALAASSIAHGEALLRDIGNQHELGLLLCGQARIQLRNGAKSIASRAVQEAALIAEQLQLRADAPLQQHIRAVRTRLGDVRLELR